MQKVMPMRNSTVANLCAVLLNSGHPRCIYTKRELYTLMFLSVLGHINPAFIHTAVTDNELQAFFTEKAKEFQNDLSDFMLIAGGRFGALEDKNKVVEEGLAVLYIFEHRIFYLTLARERDWDVFHVFQTYIWDPASQVFEFSTEDWMDIIPIYDRSERC